MYATKICIKNAQKECSFSQHRLTKRIKKKKQNASVVPREVGPGGLMTMTYLLKRSWSFDRVHHHQLVGFVRKRLRVKHGRQECMEYCLSEGKFICRYTLLLNVILPKNTLAEMLCIILHLMSCFK